MNNETNGEWNPGKAGEEGGFVELSSELQATVAWVKQRPVPQAALERALDGALKLPSLIQTAAQRRPNPVAAAAGRWMGWIAAAAVCLAIGTWLLRPGDLWAQVLEKTQKKPWIHGTIRVPGSDDVQEFWISTARGQSASRSKEQILVVDRVLGTMDRYEPQKKVLYRLPVTKDDWIQQDQLLELFEGLFRGEVKLGKEFTGLVLKAQKRSQIEKGGKKWDAFELQWTSPDRPGVQMTFFVDPQTHLPQSMTGAFGKESVEFIFDYPAIGPGDVYALGAPKDAKVIDKLPDGDMARVITALKAGHERFDDYQAMVIVGTSKELNLVKRMSFGRVYLVWKKGKKWRVEVGFAPQLQADAPPRGQSRKEWVRDSFKKTAFETMNLCDGKAVYLGDMMNKDNKRDHFDFAETIDQGQHLFGQARRAMPETWCYPFNSFPELRRLREEDYLVTTTDGLPKGVLVTHPIPPRNPNSGESLLERYWFDPQKGYAVVKSDYWTTDAMGNSPGDRDHEAINDHWEQTPSGVWYATRSGGGPIKARPDDIWFWHHCFLDFNTEIPDSLFKPEKRTVLTDVYPVAP